MSSKITKETMTKTVVMILLLYSIITLIPTSGAQHTRIVSRRPITSAFSTALSTFTTVPTTSAIVGKIGAQISDAKKRSARTYARLDSYIETIGDDRAQLIADIRRQKKRTNAIREQIDSALASVPVHSFIDRMLLQLHRIQCDKIAAILDSMLLDIVESEDEMRKRKFAAPPLPEEEREEEEVDAAVRHNTARHFSETLEIANNVAHAQFVRLIASANATNRVIDKLIARIIDRQGLSSSPQQQQCSKTKTKSGGRRYSITASSWIDRRLETLASEAGLARSELSQEYMQELSKLAANTANGNDIGSTGAQKPQLNMVQRMQTEKFLDSFQHMIQFIRSYQRMLRRLHRR